MQTFDRTFARLLLEICRYTYAAVCDDAQNRADMQDALNWINGAGNAKPDELKLLKGSGTSYACLTAYPDKNIVSYMGTLTEFVTPHRARESLNDWLNNFRVAPVPFALTVDQLGADYPATTNKDDLGGLVHAGFLSELHAVQATVVAELFKHGGRSRPLYVTGHSQGGAEAALATRALLAGGFPVVATYTFAAPRAGNGAFVASVPATLPVHRIEFGDDLVPHVPPLDLVPKLRELAAGLQFVPFLDDEAKRLLNTILGNELPHGYAELGTLCYGSDKTQALRVDLDAAAESALFADRLWSLVRHPDRWGDHHHLAGTDSQVAAGQKGNYTALVSNFVQLP